MGLRRESFRIMSPRVIETLISNMKEQTIKKHFTGNTRH